MSSKGSFIFAGWLRYASTRHLTTDAHFLDLSWERNLREYRDIYKIKYDQLTSHFCRLLS